MRNNIVVVLACAIIAAGCSRVSTTWHKEPVTETSVTMNGSYHNAIDTLVVKSHEWKITAMDPNKNQAEWGFRVVFECKDHPDYPDDTNYPGRAFMPIEAIQYALYDKDDFHLTTLTLQNKDLGLCFRDTQTFQQSRSDKLELLKRAVHGRINIKAGYHWEKKPNSPTKPPTVP